MATYSQYKNLELPVSPDRYDISVFNKNNMVIDSELHRLDLKNQSQDNLLAAKETLNAEISRAKNKENEITNDITNETNRAILSENHILQSLSEHTVNELNPHKVTREQLNLGNVNNTADIDKPVSTAQQNAIDSAVSNHDTSNASHHDIRNLISDLTARLNALADSDDTTLDQLSEIIAYIKNNKSLIDSITTSKVSVSDIIDNLISKDTDKPLSAGQGKVLKELTDALQSSLDNHINDTANHISSTERTAWTDANNKKHSHKNSSVIDKITQTLLDNWNAAYAYSQSSPSLTDATKTEKSEINGNIKINGTETKVYTHPGGTNPHGTTKSDIGLGNVPNVSTNNQTPTFTQAGTRSNLKSGENLSTIFGKVMKWFADLKTVAFTGSYNDLSNKPSIPAAVAVKGNAESTYRVGNVNITPANIGSPTISDFNTLKKSVADGKASIASAITAKGVSTAADAAFATMAANILKIPSGGGAAYYGTVIQQSGYTSSLSHSIAAAMTMPAGHKLYHYYAVGMVGQNNGLYMDGTPNAVQTLTLSGIGATAYINIIESGLSFKYGCTASSSNTLTVTLGFTQPNYVGYPHNTVIVLAGFYSD